MQWSCYGKTLIFHCCFGKNLFCRVSVESCFDDIAAADDDVVAVQRCSHHNQQSLYFEKVIDYWRTAVAAAAQHSTVTT